MDSSIKLGRVFGIPVGVHYSWFLILFMVTFLLSGDFGGGYKGWAAALGTALLFFLSVLAHELSHSVVALSRGIPVKGITLFVFGGVSQISREASRPLVEFMIAIVGPLCSVLLGFAFWGLYFALNDISHLLADMASVLGTVNIVLGIFNMLPGFPLDGGRVLRAVLWWATRSYWTATRIATGSGQGIALLLVGGGVVVVVLDNLVQGVWLMLIGLFLFSIASASYRQMRHRENLRHRTALDLMTAQCPLVPGDLSLSQIVEIYGAPSGSMVILATQGGQVTGLLTSQAIASVPRDRWDHILVQAVATPVHQATAVAPDDDALRVLELMEEKDLNEVIIVSEGTLLGCVCKESIRTLARAQMRRAT